jgi:hypothetical protein
MPQPFAASVMSKARSQSLSQSTPGLNSLVTMAIHRPNAPSTYRVKQALAMEFEPGATSAPMVKPAFATINRASH